MLKAEGHGRTRLELLRTLPRGMGAELGVFKGDFSAEILCCARPARLWLVDLFAGSVTSGDADGENFDTANMAEVYGRLKARFAGRRVEVVKAISFMWLNERPSSSLDWVYIDTDHTYNTTRLELRAARLAVRDGGVIAGHDYSPFWFPGVVRAVNEFAEEHGLDLEVYDGDRLASYRMLNAKG